MANNFFDRIAFWKRKVKEEFTSSVGQKAYEVSHSGFAEFQDDMYLIKAFEFEAMQQKVDIELKRELEMTIERNQFLEKRLQALKALDDKFMIVRN